MDKRQFVTGAVGFVGGSAGYVLSGALGALVGMFLGGCVGGIAGLAYYKSAAEGSSSSERLAGHSITR